MSNRNVPQATVNSAEDEEAEHNKENMHNNKNIASPIKKTKRNCLCKREIKIVGHRKNTTRTRNIPKSNTQQDFIMTVNNKIIKLCASPI